MNIKLINTPTPGLRGKLQILTNRGIPLSEVDEYVSFTFDQISGPEALGVDQLNAGVQFINDAVTTQSKMAVVVDCDTDGLTSSALFLNWLHEHYPSYVEDKVDYFFHEGKIHGLADMMDNVCHYDYIVLPDSSSNDMEYHKELHEHGSRILVMDHHEAECISPWVIMINNQLSDYPNKALSGAGIVYLFAKYYDAQVGKRYADQFLDLAALGAQGDMMDGRSRETRAFIFEGMKTEHIKNPFILGMSQKNEFSLQKSDYQPSPHFGLAFSPIGASFFIIPMMNAICRSGTQEEKELIFDSMLTYKAFKQIPSNKRGHKPGEMETVLAQALRTATNVKNRQERFVTVAMEHLEKRIEEEHLLDHKVLLFLLEPDEVAAGIAGLVANKLMAKYQRCCGVLTSKEDRTWTGSMRGYSGSGLSTFKDVCAAARGVNFVAGHQMAFGASIYKDQVDAYLEDTDKALASLPDEAAYFVDYLWKVNEIDPYIITDISDMNDFILTEMPRSYIGITHIPLRGNMSILKGTTVKISTPCGVDIMKFGATEEEIANLQQGGCIDVVGICNLNSWNGSARPQIIVKDWEKSMQYFF